MWSDGKEVSTYTSQVPFIPISVDAYFVAHIGTLSNGIQPLMLHYVDYSLNRRTRRFSSATMSQTFGQNLRDKGLAGANLTSTLHVATRSAESAISNQFACIETFAISKQRKISRKLLPFVTERMVRSECLSMLSLVSNESNRRRNRFYCSGIAV